MENLMVSKINKLIEYWENEKFLYLAANPYVATIISEFLKHLEAIKEDLKSGQSKKY